MWVYVGLCGYMWVYVGIGGLKRDKIGEKNLKNEEKNFRTSTTTLKAVRMLGVCHNWCSHYIHYILVDKRIV